MGVTFPIFGECVNGEKVPGIMHFQKAVKSGILTYGTGIHLS